MKKIIIAFDGYSSTGKSTIAKKVAKELGYVYIDTGAMYRAVTLLALRKGWVEANFAPQKLLSLLQESTLSFTYCSERGFAPISLNGEEVEEEIRSLKVAQYVSQVAKDENIRAYLVQLQQQMGQEKGVVMDGRDIGTVVFPKAELKIFLTADEQIRAQRRLRELLVKKPDTTLEEVLENIKTRDYEDTHRSVSPLRKAPDAIEIDNSHTTIAEVVERVVGLAKQHISAC